MLLRIKKLSEFIIFYLVMVHGLSLDMEDKNLDKIIKILQKH